MSITIFGHKRPNRKIHDEENWFNNELEAKESDNMRQEVGDMWRLEGNA